MSAPAVAADEREGRHRRPRRRRPRPGRRTALGLELLVLFGVLALAAPLATGALPVNRGGNGLTFGVTHTQDSVEPWNPEPARARAEGVLSAVAPLQNQALMGWGALNPEPRPGSYSWDSLDQRIDTITSTGAEPVLTLCCAPDWMKGGRAGTTDWSRIEVAPTPDHFRDFAALAAEAAQRYPQVHRFIVWNELKGFYDDAANDWDIAAYTDLYNDVYRAVKKVRPSAEVGGPYAVLDSWSSPKVTSNASSVAGPWGVLDERPLAAITYWLKHAVGADFVVVDGGTETLDAGLVVPDFEATAKLAAATAWLRRTTSLPIWWAEIYADTDDPKAPAGDPRRAAVMADALIRVARAGASVALLWQPRASSSLRSAALFTSTATTGGGQPLPLVSLLQMISGPLREDPRHVTGTWDPASSTFTVSVPDGHMTWSAAHGLQGASADGGATPTGR